MEASHLLIEVWPDVVCPWCYIGKRNLEAALINFVGKSKVAVKHRVSKVASEAGLQFRLAETETGNTLDAHRLLLWSQNEGDHETLLLIAIEAGYPEFEVKSLLASDTFIDEVEEDQRMASNFGAFAQVLVKASA